MILKDGIKKYRNYILVISTIIISCAIYWNYLIGHFATETYSVALGYQNYGVGAHLVDGRFFSSLLLIGAGKLNIPILTFMSISVFWAIVVATIAILQLKNTIAKLVKLNTVQEFVVWLISYCTIFNFMMVEIMYFPETCVMVASILFYIISAKFFIEKKYIHSFLILIIAVFCYQGTIGFFVVCCFLFSIIKNKKIGKEVLLDICKIALMGIVASGLNLLFIKIISQVLNLTQHKKFGFGIDTIIKNIEFIFKNIYTILQENCGLFPENVLLICVEIILIFALAVSNHEKKYNSIMNLIILMLVTIGSSFVMFIIQKGSMYTGRVHFCIGSLIGVAMLYLYSATNIKNEKIWHKIFLVILISYIVLNCANTINLVTEHQKVNELEKQECMRIGEMIEEYENNTKTKVTKVAPVLILKQEENGFFSETSRRTVVTYNNIRHYYGYSGILQYYLRKNLKDVGLNRDYEKIYLDYIIENNLEYGDIICINDTLYCPQYIT